MPGTTGRPSSKLPDGIAYDERLVQRFESLTDEELARVRLSLFGMELDPVALARLQLADHVLHTWDVAVPLDPAALVAPDAVALLIDTLRPTAKRVATPHGKDFRLSVHTSAPERHFCLAVGNEVESVEREDSGANAELRIHAEAFLPLIYG